MIIIKSSNSDNKESKIKRDCISCNKIIDIKTYDYD